MTTNYLHSDNRLRIHTANGHTFLKVSDILYCRADGNYTEFFLKDVPACIVACRNLKFYEKILRECGFWRIHQSWLVNSNQIGEHKRDKGGSTGGTVIMSNQKELPVSRQHKRLFK